MRDTSPILTALRKTVLLGSTVGRHGGRRPRIARLGSTLLIAGGCLATPAHLHAQAPLSIREIRERQIECIAITVYGEARGEDPLGKAAVAWTVMNRVRSTGDDACGVVLRPDQFVALNPAPLQRYLRDISAGRTLERAYARTPAEAEALTQARTFARSAFHGIGPDPSGGALNFVTADFQRSAPADHWSRNMLVTARIGGHVFMRPANAVLRYAGAPGSPDDLAARGITQIQPRDLLGARLAEAFADMLQRPIPPARPWINR